MKIGDRFGRWTVLGVPTPTTAKSRAFCRCDCGHERNVTVDHLRRGVSASCGCLRRELATESRRPPMDRFMEKVDKDENSGCWNWTGHLNENGYGRFWADGKRWPAHRWIAEQTYGPLGHEEPDHLCRNRRCVNPEHLEPVTHRVNSQRAAYVAAQCSSGHLLPPPSANGRRVCRKCANKRNREYKARKRKKPMAQYDAITGGAR